jgi:hypothetical protein
VQENREIILEIKLKKLANYDQFNIGLTFIPLSYFQNMPFNYYYNFLAVLSTTGFLATFLTLFSQKMLKLLMHLKFKIKLNNLKVLIYLFYYEYKF